MKPLAIDLFCGLGGWAEGLLGEGWDVVGFDIERHCYPERTLPSGDGRKVGLNSVDFNNKGASETRSFNYANEAAIRNAPLTGRWMKYPGQLVLQDVLTLHGSQFRIASLIVASPPCQEYSYMAMPWKRAKAKAAAIRADTSGKMLAELNRLFDACFRIGAEASLAAGRKIPLIVENVRGAQPWVGRARWNYGSFYLWGDVPALMPFTDSRFHKIVEPSLWLRDPKRANGQYAPNYTKNAGFRFDGSGRSFQSESVDRHVKIGGGAKIEGIGWTGFADTGSSWRNREDAISGSWFRVSHNNVPHSRGDAIADGRKHDGQGWRENGTLISSNRMVFDGIKQGGTWWHDEGSASRTSGSGSPRRKMASAMIARIPEPLARHIAAVYRP